MFLSVMLNIDLNMEYNQDLSQRHPIDLYHYNELWMGSEAQRKNAYERLMNHSPSQYQFAEEQNLDEVDAKEDSQEQENCYASLLTLIGDCCVPFRIACPCLFCQFCICKGHPLFEQPTGNLGLLQEWGKFKGFLQPGLNVINPLSQSVLQVGMQTQLTKFRQEGMSKDNVNLRLGVSIVYRVTNGFKLTYRLSVPPDKCIADIASATLRCIIGKNMLQTIIEHQTQITEDLKEELNQKVSFWGLYVEACLLKCNSAGSQR